jgi:hypothetical protein
MRMRDEKEERLECTVGRGWDMRRRKGGSEKWEEDER